MCDQLVRVNSVTHSVKRYVHFFSCIVTVNGRNAKKDVK